MESPIQTLLVIGIHREELAFGQSVAAMLNRTRIDVLSIPDGLSGQHPLPDERFRYEMLHRALYLQLIPHVRGRYSLLIDLHTGLDEEGPCADIYTCTPEQLKPPLAGLMSPEAVSSGTPRLVRLGHTQASGRATGADGVTIIPPDIRQADDFLYAGIEIYLPQPGPGTADDWLYAAEIINALAGAPEHQAAVSTRSPGERTSPCSKNP